MQAAIYVRVSTPGQEDDGTSLDTQEKACRTFCAANGWLVRDVYREQFSGFTRERPKLSELRESVRRRAIEVVVILAIDRLSRNQTDLAILWDEMEHNHVRIACVTEPLEDTAAGKFLVNARAFVAEVEREKIKERTLRGKRARVQAGKIHSHGIELYGYRRDKDVGLRIVDESEAAIVRLIFQLAVDESIPLRGVASRLNMENIPSPAVGKLTYQDIDRMPRWGKPQVARILRNPAYKGEGIAWRWQQNKHRSSSLRPESDWVRLPDAVTPALVSTDLWDAAQRILDSNRAADSTRNENRPYLLRGHVYCAVCGRRMRAEPEHGRRIYRCSSRHTAAGACGASRVPADEVERWSWDQVASLLANPETIAEEIERRHDRGQDEAMIADRAAAERSLDKISRQQERLIRRFTEGSNDSFPWELVQREISRLDGEKKGIQSVIADLDRMINSHQEAIVRFGSVAAYCERVTAKLSTFDFGEKRLAFDALDIRVIASGHEWRIQGAIPIEESGASYHASS